jgi:hypothetical protein
LFSYGHFVAAGGAYPDHRHALATRRRERNLLKDIDETAKDAHRISTDVQDMRDEDR